MVRIRRRPPGDVLFCVVQESWEAVRGPDLDAVAGCEGLREVEFTGYRCKGWLWLAWKTHKEELVVSESDIRIRCCRFREGQDGIVVLSHGCYKKGEV